MIEITIANNPEMNTLKARYAPTVNKVVAECPSCNKEVPMHRIGGRDSCSDCKPWIGGHPRDYGPTVRNRRGDFDGQVAYFTLLNATPYEEDDDEP
jgi:hypothetical protein|tara:strand:- start:1499 stop:1786 length:288 start_codon:yes stop_codon:yes gene_type:complete